MTKEDYKVLANEFLIQAYNDDQKKPTWLTKNHVPTLHQSLDEFFLWLQDHYWDIDTKTPR